MVGGIMKAAAVPRNTRIARRRTAASRRAMRAMAAFAKSWRREEF